MLVAFNATTHLLCESIARNEYEMRPNPLPMVKLMYGRLNQSLLRGKLIFISVYIILLLSGRKTKQTKRDSFGWHIRALSLYWCLLLWGRNSVRLLSQMRILLSHISWFATFLHFFSLKKMHRIPFKYINVFYFVKLISNTAKRNGLQIK